METETYTKIAFIFMSILICEINGIVEEIKKDKAICECNIDEEKFGNATRTVFGNEIIKFVPKFEADFKSVTHMDERSIIKFRKKDSMWKGKAILDYESKEQNDCNADLTMKATQNCEICEINFKLVKDYKNHYDQMHKGIFPYRCRFGVCNKRYSSKSALKYHLKTYHAKVAQRQPPPLRCPLCDMELKNLTKWQEHAVNQHPGEKCVNCDGCDMKFFTMKALRRHYVNAHKNRDFYCQYCEKSMPTSVEARIHKQKCEDKYMGIIKGDNTKGDVDTLEFNRWNYNSELPTYCKICDQQFKFHCHYKRHHDQNHPEIKLLACKHCGKHMSSQGCLRKHVRKFHQDVENAEGLPPKFVRKLIFKCEYCPEEIVGITNYEKHGRDKHANQDLFHCSHCMKGFKRNSRMTLHLKESHGMGGALCKFCGKRYARMLDLREHEKKCENGRNAKRKNTEGYFCDICQKMIYLNKKPFRNHVAHCAEYEKCTMCEQRFHKSNRRQIEHHMSIRHTARKNIEALLGTLDEYNAAVKRDKGDFECTTFQPLSIAKEEISNE